MDLIYMNANRQDVGVMLEYELDLAFGSGENNFECTVNANSHCCEAGFFIYVEGTEYGGIIDAVESKSETKEVVYSGRTWQGILDSKVLCPDPGKDYLICNGEANAVIGSLLSRLGLESMFKASESDSGIKIKNYRMDRYIKGYEGIKKMLFKLDGKLLFSFQNGVVVVSAAHAANYTEDDSFDSDLIDFTVKKSNNTVNHLICLGQGDLAKRTVIHLYADKDGNVSTTQTQFGMNEYADVYDYSSVESVDELKSSGIEQLKSLWEPASLSIDFDAEDDSYNIGDIVGAYDNITGISVSSKITKKILTIKNGQKTISYEVGE